MAKAVPRTGRPGRLRKPKKVLPKKLKYATVHKERKNGRVVKVETRVVLGTVAAGRTDRIWTTEEWAAYPAVKRLTSC